MSVMLERSTIDLVQRVVSLVPSATETLTEWGVSLVGCTRFCERDDIPTVGGTKNPQIDAIIRLKPDLVVMEREENRREDYERLVNQSIPVHVLSIQSLFDVPHEFELLAQRLGLNQEAPSIPPQPMNRAPLCVTVPIWRRPWMVLGTPTYGASVLTYLGLTVVPIGQGPYPTLAPHEFESLQTNAVLAPDEPYRFGERHRGELERIAPTFFCDGKDLFWWGIRTPHALHRLDHLLKEVRDNLDP